MGKLVPSLAAVVDEIVVGFEDAVGEPVIAHKLPDIFDRVEFGTFRRQWEEGDVRRHDESRRHVPACLIDQKDGMGTGGDDLGDLREVRTRSLELSVSMYDGTPECKAMSNFYFRTLLVLVLLVTSSMHAAIAKVREGECAIVRKKAETSGEQLFFQKGNNFFSFHGDEGLLVDAIKLTSLQMAIELNSSFSCLQMAIVARRYLVSSNVF